MFRKTQKTVGVLVLFIFICLMLTACAQKVQMPNEAPLEIIEFFTDYLEASKSGVEEAIQFRYFSDEYEKNLVMESYVRTLDYEIEHVERVNDNLYAFTVLLCNEVTNGGYLRIYNFVGKIDGSLQVIANGRNIPDEIREGFDADDYINGLQESESGIDEEKEIIDYIIVPPQDLL